MKLPRILLRSERASAAAELALILPLLLVLFFGTFELGNLFLTQHTLSKQVRDGVRFASKLTLAEDYSCASNVFESASAESDIISVTKRGSLDATVPGSLYDAYWETPCSGAPVAVTFRCVDKGTNYGGVYQELDGPIAVVQVATGVIYRPILTNAIGFNNAGICLRASAEAPVIGL
jgi:hypothetical protein